MDRLRSRVIGEPGGHRAGDQAVLYQDGEQGVGHAGLARRRQPAEQHETGHLTKGDLSQELFGQVVAANQNSVQLGLPQAGDDFRLVAHRDSLAFFLLETYGKGGACVKPCRSLGGLLRAPKAMKKGTSLPSWLTVSSA